MKEIPSFKEDHISQIPALQLLINLGYEYLTPAEALDARGGRASNVILHNILDKKLRAINKINFRDGVYEFSNSNINAAVDAIKNVHFDGLVRTNELIYDMLTLGKSFEETIQGNTKSFTLNYIDWKNIENNIFHVTEEFEVERTNHKSTCRPDIILFVNGIPFMVIECKRPDIDDSIHHAIKQHIRNQNSEHIPSLFIYSQILMAVNKNEAKYSTVDSKEKYWSVWNEKIFSENEVVKIVNTPLNDNVKNKLFSGRYKYVQDYFNEIEKDGRLVTEQDKSIYSICKKERLMEFSYQFIVFDKGHKKIARYQQYYSIKRTLARVKTFEKSKKRNGGVIWHTQGSGKSLTMVMLAKALVLDDEIKNPRVVLVTDRVNLDAQIWDTFRHCGLEPEKASTGANLLELLEKNKTSVITSVIDKFESAINKKKNDIVSDNVFVLVDESHRSQYGKNNVMMQRVLPDACYIGFTGTPLFKKDKHTTDKFGGFIDKYTIDQAVKDKAVLSLLYEGRHIIQDVNQKPIDTWFERVCEPLSEFETADLKKKYSRVEKLNKTDQTIYMIAYDISKHYSETWKGTGLKGQVATSSKVAALKFKKFMDEMGKVSTEVIISSPDKREGYIEVDEEPDGDVHKFWKKMMERFGSEEKYNRELISAFGTNGDPDLLIVVDKLLTGFDEPRNTVLYIAKPLTEHNLLQAIARVNRLYEGKDFGYIIDYQGILGELDRALNSYTALEGFDEDDLEGALVNVREEVNKLPQKYSELIDIFKGIKNRKDEEEYELLLFDERLRKQFYEKLSAYSRTLGVAVSTRIFHEENDDKQIKSYTDSLKFYQSLRASVKRRYAESIDFKEYEAKIQKLLNTYVTSDEVIRITEPFNIFDKENFQKELERIEGKAARADMIAHRMKKSIAEKMEEDPVFYKKFSKLIEEAIKDYREHRIDEAEYFLKMKEAQEAFVNREDSDMPGILKNREAAKAFYGIVSEILSKNESDDKIKNLSAKIGIGIDDIILKNIIVDWHYKQDIQNRIINEIEDYLADHPDLNLNYDQIDIIIEAVMNVAKRRYAQ